MKCEALPWAFKSIIFPVRKGLSTCAIYWRNRKLCYSVVFSAPENFAMHELKDTSTCKSWACTPPPWSFECGFPSGTWRMISMPVLPLPSPATSVTSYNHNLEMFIAICNWAVDLAIGRYWDTEQEILERQQYCFRNCPSFQKKVLVSEHQYPLFSLQIRR